MACEDGRRWLVALAFLLALAAPASAGRSDPMYIALPIMVPDGRSIENIRRAVRQALAAEEFSAREISAGQIQAERTKVDKHNESYTVVVDLHYDSEAIRISYRDSKDLNYDPKTGTIHGTYNHWVRGIERRIRKELWSH